MAGVTPVIPSGSTDGAPIKVAQTATPGTLFHTADAVAIDEVWLWATNTDTVDRNLTVEFGGPTAPDYNIKAIIPAGETVLVVAGTRLKNSKTVKAFASQANVINMYGNINRWT